MKEEDGDRWEHKPDGDELRERECRSEWGRECVGPVGQQQ